MNVEDAFEHSEYRIFQFSLKNNEYGKVIIEPHFINE